MILMGWDLAGEMLQFYCDFDCQKTIVIVIVIEVGPYFQIITLLNSSSFLKVSFVTSNMQERNSLDQYIKQDKQYITLHLQSHHRAGSIGSRGEELLGPVYKARQTVHNASFAVTPQSRQHRLKRRGTPWTSI